MCFLLKGYFTSHSGFVMLCIIVKKIIKAGAACKRPILIKPLKWAVLSKRKIDIDVCFAGDTVDS